MKTLMYLRKRLGHLAIGPLVGAIVAGLLLIILMLNINNGSSLEHTRIEKHAFLNSHKENSIIAVEATTV